MKLNKDTMKIISDMEHIIGSQCYNPNSYNGWTGEEGCSYRYPVYSAQRDGDNKYVAEKHWGKIENLESENIGTIKYKFGSNHLYIGDGLQEILEYLEERYKIDFSELEARKRKGVA